MTEIPSTVHPSCWDFVVVVEELLKQRRDEGSKRSVTAPTWQQETWGPRKWHHTELEDMVYSSYKRMRQGHITRPPRREIVMELASYLDCTLQERNRLLVAAGTLPVESYLEGPELRTLVEIASEVAKDLLMPVMIINRDWSIQYVNNDLLLFYNLSASQLAAIPREQLNVLHLLFDPTLPLQANLRVNPDSWRNMALQTIYGFRMANVLCQFETWYQKIVNQLMELPNFAQCWRSVEFEQRFFKSTSPEKSLVVETTLPQDKTKKIWIRPLTISIGYFQFDFPQIVGLAPANRDTQICFKELGLAVPAQQKTDCDGHFVL